MDLMEEDNVFSSGAIKTGHGALCPAANLNDVFLKEQVKMLLIYISNAEVGKLNFFVN